MGVITCIGIVFFALFKLLRRANMIIKTILNNNAVIAFDENKREVVIVKNGIGFKSKKGDSLENTDMEKVFILKGKGVSKNTIDLLSQIDDDIIGVSKKIVKYGRENLKKPIHASIFVTLSDHITLAIQRKKNGIVFNNPLNFDIKKIYKDEYHVGEVALQIIKHDLNIKFSVEETGLIALHFVNAEINDNPESMQDMASITLFIQRILSFVKFFFLIEYDEDSIDYYRFVRHLQFFAQRLFNKKSERDEKRVDTEVIELMELMKPKYPKVFDCSERIKALIKKEYYMEISIEEQFYLLIYIKRLTL